MVGRVLVLLGLVAASSCVLQRWSVKDGTKVCVLVETELEGQVSYLVVNETKTFNFKANETLKMDGNCNAKWNGTKAQTLIAEFLVENAGGSALETQPWKIELTFTAPHQNLSFQLSDWALEAGSPVIQDYTKSADAVTDFTASEPHAFKCSSVGLSFVNASVQLRNLRAIAFTSLDTNDFPKMQMYEVCQLDSRTSDIVPIVVGACLAGLVIVVLVAYLIGRARAKRQGYASV